MAFTKATAARVRRELAKERYPAKKGDYVVLTITHVPQALIGSGVRMSPYDSLHLTVVTQANANGTALRVKLVGAQTDLAVAHVNGRITTMQGADKQALAKALAATFTCVGENDFSSVETLKAALLSGKREAC